MQEQKTIITDQFELDAYDKKCLELRKDGWKCMYQKPITTEDKVYIVAQFERYVKSG